MIERKVVESRQDLVDMLNDVINSTKKYWGKKLTLSELVGDAKNVKEATRNTLFRLGEVLTVDFYYRNEHYMSELFNKYVNNINVEVLFEEVESYRKMKLPFQLPETEAEIRMKINELKDIQSKGYVAQNAYRYSMMVTIGSTARLWIEKLEGKLKEMGLETCK